MDVDVFVSHHTSTSLHIVEAIVNRLESMGISCWYAPRDTEGSYAGVITRAISSCRVFLLILNKPASESPHVLNEIDLVTKRLAKKESVTIIPFHTADEDIADDAQYYIGRLHWIDAVTPPMYKRIEELCELIAKSLGRTDDAQRGQRAAPVAMRLISKIPEAREVFFGREMELSALESALRRDRIVYVEGIGGIGKSELVKQYMLSNQDKYDSMLFLTYTGSLRQLVCAPDQIEIEGFSRGEGEAEGIFSRTLRALRSAAGERTLIVIDNYDVDSDPDVTEFTRGSYKIIFTTRNSHPGCVTVKINPIPDTDVLLKIFELNYGMGLDDEDIPYIKKLFAMVEYHTYAVELLAKQMSASFLTGQELFEKFREIFSGEPMEEVSGRSGMNTVLEHFCSLFSLSGLDEEEKQIISELSLIGPEGIPAQIFRGWAGLDSFETVNKLIKRSWIRREKGQRLSLHPLVSEVAWRVLRPTSGSCRAFLSNMTDFLFSAWFRPYRENMAVKSCAIAVAEYFRPFDTGEVEVWGEIPDFLWQVGEFDTAIKLGTEIFDSVKKRFGRNSMEAVYIQKIVGSCYFNAGKLDESVPWFLGSLESALSSGTGETEDVAMAYEKTARCYTWEHSRDMDKAEEYFQKALEIRKRLITLLEKGEKLEMFEKRQNYGMITAKERLEESYMEMGRMYQAAGQYQKALDNMDMERGIFEALGAEKYVSGMAYIDYDEGVCRYHLAMELREKGKMDKADAELDRALIVLNRALEANMRMRGDVAIDTIDNQEVIGDVYAAQGRYGDASNAYMAVVNMLTSLLGPECGRIETVKGKMNFA